MATKLQGVFRYLHVEWVDYSQNLVTFKLNCASKREAYSERDEDRNTFIFVAVRVVYKILLEMTSEKAG